MRQTANGRNHDGSSSGENLISLHGFADGDGLLLDLIPPGARQLNDGPPRDAGQDGALKWRRADSVPFDNEDVAAGHLLQVGVGLGVQVDDVREPLALGGQLCDQHGGVVAGALGAAHAAGGGPVEARLHDQVDGGELPSLEVRSNGSAVHNEGVGGSGAQAQDGAAAHQQGAQVKRSLALRRNEIGVGAHGLLDAADEQVLGGSDHGHACSAGGHAVGVAIGAEEDNAALGAALCLHALKNGLSVVECLGGRVHGQRAVGLKLALRPCAVLNVVGSEEHVLPDVGKAKPERVPVDFRLASGQLCAWGLRSPTVCSMLRPRCPA